MRADDSEAQSEFVPNFDEYFGGKNRAAYMFTYIDSETDIEAELAIGSDEGNLVWLNGKVVHKKLVERGYKSMQDRAPITLKKGRNTMLVRITQSWGGWQAGAYILGSDGRPAKGVTYSLD